jgi:hypothetical protein
MSNFNAPPPPVPLTDYPGYFPPSKPPFWTRLKTSTAVGALALFVEIGIGAADGSTPSNAASIAPKTPGLSAGAVQQQVDQAVAEATGKLNDKLSSQRSTLLARLADQHDKAVSAKQAAVAAAVARTHAADRAKQAAAVAAATAKARQFVATSNPPAQQPSSPPASSSNLDPRFSYCYEANDAGYGPYYQGQDPEYYWYEDADNDGIDCEP